VSMELSGGLFIEGNFKEVFREGGGIFYVG
jgi:hypothetical protein